MKRLFWLGLGVAAGVQLSRKASAAARQATPAGVAVNLGEAIGELASAIGAFGADVRAGMTERESQLHDYVERTAGVPTRPVYSASAGRHAYPEAAHPRPRRARRADG